jgi:cytochrome P450
MARHMMPPKEAQSFIPNLERVMRDCSGGLRGHGGAVDEYVPLMTYEMICSILLDRRPGIVRGAAADLDERFVRTSRRVFPLMAELMAPEEMPRFLRGDSPVYAEFERAMLDVMDMGEEFIDEFLERFERHRDDPTHTVHSSYFAKMLTHEQGVLNKHQMNINFSNLIFAGVDTTSNVVQWMFYHLARNPGVQDKMRAEMRDTLGGRDVETSQDFKALKYCKQVMKETYRLSPPVFGSARYLPEDIEIRGQTVAAGTMIRLHPLPYLMNEEVWDDPEAFVPERWDREEKRRRKAEGKARRRGGGGAAAAAAGGEGGCPMSGGGGGGGTSSTDGVADHSYLWIVPFGVGKRMCMGARLAQVEVVAMFARFLQDYEIVLREDSPTPTPVFKMGMIEPSPSPTYEFRALDDGKEM